VNAAASGRFGVSTVARGINTRRAASKSSSLQNRAPDVDPITGSTTSGNPAGNAATTASINPAPGSSPAFAAATGKPSSAALICATTRSTATGDHAATPALF